MIHIVATLGGRKHSAPIVLPGRGITANAQGCGLQGGVDGRLGLGDGGRAADLVHGRALRTRTRAVLGRVRVARLGILTALLDNPGHGLGRVSPIASLVIAVTVHYLLGGTDLGLLPGDQHGGLDGLSGGEGPARAALLLIFDRRGHSPGNPINVSSGLFFSMLDGVAYSVPDLRSILSLQTSHLGLELTSAHIGELGEAKSGTKRAILVQRGNLFGVNHEIQESGILFLSIGMRFVPVSVVLLEGHHARETFRGSVDFGANIDE